VARERRQRDDEYPGKVLRVHGNNTYRLRVQLGEQEVELLASLSGNMRRFRIAVSVADKVQVRVRPPYDRGIITFRER
jgi:translation initiation factor IF-1